MDILSFIIPLSSNTEFLVLEAVAYFPGTFHEFLHLLKAEEGNIKYSWMAPGNQLYYLNLRPQQSLGLETFEARNSDKRIVDSRMVGTTRENRKREVR